MHARQKLGTSERLTCQVTGLARSTLQYQPAPKDDDALRLALIRLAKQYGRYGYRKVCELLCVEGWRLNHKKVERLWREEGLQLPHRHKKRRRLYHHDASVIRLRPRYTNHIWSVDFVHDKLSNSRSYKMLTVLDEYTREALSVTVAQSMGSSDVLEALYASPETGPADISAIGQRPRVRGRPPSDMVEEGRYPTHPDLSGITMGERIQ